MQGKGITTIFEGKEYENLKEVAKAAGVNYYTLYKRIREKGMSCDDAVVGIRKYNKRKKNTLEEIETAEIIKDKPENNSIEILSDGEIVEIEEFVSTKYGPIHVTVNDPKAVIDELDHMDIENINLIDYENMVDYPEIINAYINRKNTLNIFFYNATIYSNQFFNMIKDCENINLQVLIYKSKDQLVDHLVIYYFGAISTAYPDKRYTILSRDHGYYSFVETLSNRDIRVAGYNYIPTKKDRYKYALCKYIINDRTLSHRSCIKDTEFEKVFEDFLSYNGNISAYKINRLYDFLIDNDLMEFATKESLTLYKFKMDVINDYVKQYS